MKKTTKGCRLEDTFFGLTAEGFEFVNRLNLVGTVLPCQVFCKEMLKRGGSQLLLDDGFMCYSGV